MMTSITKTMTFLPCVVLHIKWKVPTDPVFGLSMIFNDFWGWLTKFDKKIDLRWPLTIDYSNELYFAHFGWHTYIMQLKVTLLSSIEGVNIDKLLDHIKEHYQSCQMKGLQKTTPVENQQEASWLRYDPNSDSLTSKIILVIDMKFF